MRRSRLKIILLYFVPHFSVYTKFGIDPHMQMIALHKNGLDAFSALCYFFAMILPALQGSAVRCSIEIIPSSVLPLSRSSSFFTAKLLVP